MKIAHICSILFAVFVLSYDVLETKYEACKGTKDPAGIQFKPIIVSTDPYMVEQLLCAISTVHSTKESYKSREVAESIAAKVKSMAAANVTVKKQ